jgi:hypothetical protein
MKKFLATEEFMNEPSDVHPVWFGLTTAFKQYHRYPLPEDIPPISRDEINRKYHYYLLGFYAGRILQIIIIGIMIRFGFYEQFVKIMGVL